MRVGKRPRKLVDIDGFIVRPDILIPKVLFGNKPADTVVLLQLHDRAVHPALIFCNKRQAGIRILHQLPERIGIKDQIRLQQQRI